MKNNKDDILIIVITLASIYFFKELRKLFSIIFNSSHSNALSLLKTINLEDLKAEQKVENTSTKLKSDIQNIVKKQNRKFLPKRHKKCS